MNKSESIKNLAIALTKFQGEVSNPKNTTTNPFFKSKYAPLDEVINTVKPLLAKYGLSFMQSPSGNGQDVIITTLIIHESGEWIESEALILKAEKATPQGVGSAISYGRRYSLSSVLGISSEDDDDGNHSSGNTKKEDNKIPVDLKNDKAVDNDVISEGQAKRLFAIVGKENQKIAKEVMLKYGYTQSKDIKKTDYEKIVNEIQAALPKAQ